eukprot:scaffold2088_cov399-Prasinococcus_capsulatus_cf.AAC.37
MMRPSPCTGSAESEHRVPSPAPSTRGLYTRTPDVEACCHSHEGPSAPALCIPRLRCAARRRGISFAVACLGAGREALAKRAHRGA